MDVANCSPQQLLELSCSFCDIEGSGSNIYWMLANRSVLTLLDNTRPDGNGAVNVSEPFLSVDDVTMFFNACLRT